MLDQRDRSGSVKVLAVTGGGQGIGRAIAYHFARAGYWVSLADPDARAGREAVLQIEALGGKALFAAVDVAKPADVARWMWQTVRVLGCPDVLVNNAGIMH